MYVSWELDGIKTGTESPLLPETPQTLLGETTIEPVVTVDPEEPSARLNVDAIPNCAGEDGEKHACSGVHSVDSDKDLVFSV
jgi:hypothetical protein